jgi:hypothetical protein
VNPGVVRTSVNAKSNQAAGTAASNSSGRSREATATADGPSSPMAAAPPHAPPNTSRLDNERSVISRHLVSRHIARTVGD